MIKNLWGCGLLLLWVCLTSCEKDKAAKPAENPITTLLNEQPEELTVVTLRTNSFRESGNNRSGQRNQGPFTLAFKASGGDVLPATKGSITLYASRSGDGSTVDFPSSSLSQFSSIGGFPEFTFVPD